METEKSCRECGRAVKWLTSQGGKKLLCDAAPALMKPAGGPLTYMTPEGEIRRGRKSAKGTDVGYVSHRCTCPAMRQRRKEATICEVPVLRYGHRR